jgi:excisionase family DNA binding protein
MIHYPEEYDSRATGFEPEIEPLIDARAAGNILSISSATVRRKAAAGEIPAIKIGRVWRLKKSVLQRWIDDGMQRNLEAA